MAEVWIILIMAAILSNKTFAIEENNAAMISGGFVFSLAQRLLLKQGAADKRFLRASHKRASHKTNSAAKLLHLLPSYLFLFLR